MYEKESLKITNSNLLPKLLAPKIFAGGLVVKVTMNKLCARLLPSALARGY